MHLGTAEYGWYVTRSVPASGSRTFRYPTLSGLSLWDGNTQGTLLIGGALCGFEHLDAGRSLSLAFPYCRRRPTQCHRLLPLHHPSFQLESCAIFVGFNFVHCVVPIFWSACYTGGMLPRRALSVLGSSSRPLRCYTVAVGSSSQDPSTSAGSGSFTLKKIDLVPARIHRHLFGDGPLPENTLKHNPFERLHLPELEGSTILEHFRNIAAKQFEPYRRLLAQAAATEELPRMPDNWVFQTGWTMYAENGASEQVWLFSLNISIRCVKGGQ